jgi:hypothetical protein
VQGAASRTVKTRARGAKLRRRSAGPRSAVGGGCSGGHGCADLKICSSFDEAGTLFCYLKFMNLNDQIGDQRVGGGVNES